MNYSNDFINRHIGVNTKNAKEMLDYLGFNEISELIKQTIPQNIRLEKDLSLPNGLSEPRYLELIKNLGKKIRIIKATLVLDIIIQFFLV